MSRLNLKPCPFCGHKPSYFNVADRAAKPFAQGEDVFTGVCGCMNPDCPIHIVFVKVPGEPESLNFARNHFYVWQWNARWLDQPRSDKIERIIKLSKGLCEKLRYSIDIRELRQISDIYATAMEIKKGD